MDVIQYGKFGDICNILPSLNGGGRMVVGERYASLLEGCSYVEPLIRRWDLAAAIEEFPDAKVTMFRKRGALGLMWDSWLQTGLGLDEWRERPLIFDQRDRWREARTFDLAGYEGKIGLNLGSETFKYQWKRELAGCLGEAGIETKRLDSVRGVRIFDMLGILERLKLLITVDTALLHLTYAVKCPVIAIGPQDDYLFAPARDHWVRRVRESADVSEILGAL